MNNENEIIEKCRQNRVFAGLILMAAGTVFLLDQFNLIFIPYWVLTWPMALIVIGLAIGLKNNFRSSGWFYMVAIGGVFLTTSIFPNLQIELLWPVILIAIGIRLLFLKDSHWHGDRWEKRNQWKRDLHNATGYTSL